MNARLAGIEHQHESTVKRIPLPFPAKVGFGLVSLVLALAVGAPLVARNNPSQMGVPFLRPTTAHLLGTDDVGHDLWSNLVFGARVSVFVGLVTATISLVIALSVSLLAVYHRGWFEALIFRIVDLTLILPFLILVIVVAVFIGRSVGATIGVLSCVLWARPARVLRVSALRLRETPHVVVAMASGASAWWIISRHLLPRIAPQAVAQFVRLVNLAVLSEASLAFLGLGDPQRVSWGTTLFFANSHSAFLTGSWAWWILPPAIGLTLVSCGMALIGVGFEERSDPRLRAEIVGGVVSSKAKRERVRADREATPAVFDDSGIQGRSSQTGASLRDLVVEYQRDGATVRAVDNVNVTILPGSVVGLIGESGSGKSSLASAMLGLIPHPGKVVSGQLFLADQRYDLTRPETVSFLRGRKLSLIPQSAMNALNPSQRVGEQVKETADLASNGTASSSSSRPSSGERAANALASLYITSQEQIRFPHELSGGQRQRAVIASALVNAPTVVIADEATSGLDPFTQLGVLRVLTNRCADLQAGLLLISHDLPLVAKVADQLLVMYAGRVVENGPAVEVFTNPKHPYTKALLNAYPNLDSAESNELVSRMGVNPVSSSSNEVGHKGFIARKPTPIEGDVPDLRFLPSGCAFRTRCPQVEPRCADQVPQLLDLRSVAGETSHVVACHVVNGHDVQVRS